MSEIRQGAPAVAFYRMFLVDADGRYRRFVELAADDDDGALRQARRLVRQGSFELWRGGTFLSRLDSETGPAPEPAKPPEQDAGPKPGHVR